MLWMIASWDSGWGDSEGSISRGNDYQPVDVA